jgi:hypothetical protein
MSLWKFQKSALPVAAGANVVAGLIAGGTPFMKSKSVGINKRNLILTKNGWIRRIIKKNVHGNVRVMDEEIVSANPGANLKYYSNTHMRYPTVGTVYVSSNSTGGSSLANGAFANVYVVFNQSIKMSGLAGKLKLTIANTAAGNNLVAISNNTNSNTTIINANNTLVFRFKPSMSGTYKISAQVATNATATAANVVSYNSAASANLVITGAVSNTGTTFTVRRATTGG